VLFSAHRHWLWLLAHLGYYEAVWSAFIVGELVRIRVEHSIDRAVDRALYRQRVNDMVHVLSDVLSIVNYRSVNVDGSLRDPDDDPILATALAGQATVIVSLNTRDFPTGGAIAGVRFVTPGTFLAELEDRFPTAHISTQARDAGRSLP
jgi:predicted nucleic acid-binding protein